MVGLKVGSLFSGYGGLDLAVESATGAQPAWFVEFDDAPSKILAHHWPDVPNYGDVTAVDWATVPRVDILTGGTPCQDLSAAGKRAGMTEGTRSNLWVNMREAINIIRPRLVVWENVLGALSATATSDSDMEPGTGLLGDTGGGHLRALGRVAGDMAEIGYDAQWTTIRASDVGAPHRRARVFLLAYPQGVGFLPGINRQNNRSPHRTVNTPGNYCVPPLRQGVREWGEYEPAIRRWERVVGPAPAPTELNTRGNPRLAAPFAEWMMGLPSGWVTDVPGLSRADQLKAIGNGVCPQQAEAALRQLLGRISPARRKSLPA